MVYDDLCTIHYLPSAGSSEKKNGCLEGEVAEGLRQACVFIGTAVDGERDVQTAAVTSGAMEKVLGRGCERDKEREREREDDSVISAKPLIGPQMCDVNFIRCYGKIS